MPRPPRRKVLAAVNELLFEVKIREAAKRAGVQVEFVKGEKEVLEKLTQGSEKPVLLILDLNFNEIRPLRLITKLKSNEELRRVPILGYVSHGQAELKQRAQEAGCDAVMTRSAFSQNLQQLLKRYSDTC